MGDSYRPRQSAQRPRALTDRVTFTGGDRRDHQGANSQFTFSSAHGPQFPPARPEDSNGPRAQRRSQGHRGGRSGNSNNRRGPERNNGSTASHAGGGRHDNRNRRRGGWRPYRKEAPHERALLQARNNNGPEQTLGVASGTNKFLNLDDLSQSDGEMEGSDLSLDSASDAHDVPKKVARADHHARADGSSVPQWSNPDPYTVLPPPSETTGKKRDVVQLIRKAKVQAEEQSGGRNAVAANDDFISFGDELASETSTSPPLSPREHLTALPPRPPPLNLQGSLNEVVATGVLRRSTYDAAYSAEPVGLPARPKRKRGEHEGGVISEWIAGARMNTAPWCKNQSYVSRIGAKAGFDQKFKMMMLLSNEIMDFYDTFAPSRKTDAVRTDIINQVESILGRTGVLPDQGRILCFGSFPAGLYLPMADLDLVYVTERHLNGGPRTVEFGRRTRTTGILWAAANRLRATRTALKIEVIAKAKVPIIKFTDKRTNVHVDISFENLSGVEAQHTFKQWKSKYGDEMIHLVALVKQFLIMRGLNDVHTGGLGGYSIICLVVHFLERFRTENGILKDNDPPRDGEVFIGFLGYYGTEFDLATMRIVMDPIKAVRKDRVGIDGREEKPNGLSIQDPNDPQNNISGGTSKAELIFETFAEAHSILSRQIGTWDSSGRSILASVLGGNYDPYYRFMNRLHSL